MTAGFTAFCDDSISPAALHPFRQGRGSHHRNHFYSGIFPELHVFFRISGSCCHHRYFFLGNDLCHLCGIRAHEHNVDTEGLSGQLPDLVDLLPHPGSRSVGSPDDAKAPGLGDSRRQMVFCHPGHSALDDGVFGSKKRCDLCFHFHRLLTAAFRCNLSHL